MLTRNKFVVFIFEFFTYKSMNCIMAHILVFEWLLLDIANYAMHFTLMKLDIGPELRVDWLDREFSWWANTHLD